MSPFAIAVSPRLPVPVGQLIGHVVQIPADRTRYRRTELALLVRRVRLDISQWYDGAWVWLEGDELAHDGYSLGRTQALVHVSVCVPVTPSTGGAGWQPSPPPAGR
jgi:hypothetical protein